MANSKSEGRLYHGIVDISQEENKVELLMGILSYDLDLIENEEFFRKDTIELGFETEAERIIEEAVESEGSFKEVVEKVFESISDQEYYGSCDISIIKIKKDTFSVAYSIGGQ